MAKTWSSLQLRYICPPINNCNNKVCTQHININPNSVHSFNNVFVLQASSDFFTFEKEQIEVSVDGVKQNVFLALGQRQTLLLPSNLSDSWVMVSDKHKWKKIKIHKNFFWLK